MAGRLGRGVWTASVTEPGGRMVWSSTASAVRSFRFGRELSDTSTATLTAVEPKAGDVIEPWLHALTIFYDDEPAWSGIVTEVRSSRGSLDLSASDASVYWRRRRVPSARRYDQVDASHIMAQLVVDAMGLNDPLRVADTLIEYPSRIWSVIDITANSGMVEDTISDLVEAGLTWTIIAGRLLIGPGPERHTTARLTDRHLGDGIAVVKDGRDVTTDVLVLGKGVWAQQAIPGDKVGIQAIIKADALTTVQECEERAKRELAARSVAPRILDVPTGVSLSPDAPMNLGELIPGVRVPISSKQSGATLGADMMLQSVDVSGGDDGAKVSIGLGTPGMSYEEREATPPPKAFDHHSPWDKEQRDKAEQAMNRDGDENDYDKPGVPL